MRQKEGARSRNPIKMDTIQKSFINIAIKENIKDLRNMWEEIKITIPLNHSNHTIPTAMANN